MDTEENGNENQTIQKLKTEEIKMSAPNFETMYNFDLYIHEDEAIQAVSDCARVSVEGYMQRVEGWEI